MSSDGVSNESAELGAGRSPSLLHRCVCCPRCDRSQRRCCPRPQPSAARRDRARPERRDVVLDHVERRRRRRGYLSRSSTELAGSKFCAHRAHRLLRSGVEHRHRVAHAIDRPREKALRFCVMPTIGSAIRFSAHNSRGKSRHKRHPRTSGQLRALVARNLGNVLRWVDRLCSGRPRGATCAAARSRPQRPLDDALLGGLNVSSSTHLRARAASGTGLIVNVPVGHALGRNAAQPRARTPGASNLRASPGGSSGCFDLPERALRHERSAHRAPEQHIEVRATVCVLPRSEAHPGVVAPESRTRTPTVPVNSHETNAPTMGAA